MTHPNLATDLPRATLADWASQYKGELSKQSADRAALLEGLIFASDFDAIIDWLNQWQQEDSVPNSLAQKYQQTLTLLRLKQQCQSKGEVSTADLESPDADPFSQPDAKNQSN
jgi:hypothetical protein